jgi:uncharacterized protein (TIGR03437 family)
MAFHQIEEDLERFWPELDLFASPNQARRLRIKSEVKEQVAAPALYTLSVHLQSPQDSLTERVFRDFSRYFPASFQVFSGLHRRPCGTLALWQMPIQGANMIRNNLMTLAALCAGFGQVWAQAPQFATLDIGWENYVAYVNDVADPSKIGTSSGATNPSILKNFMTAILIADIVSVNGKPAKGNLSVRGQFVMLGSSPASGQAIADTSRGALGDLYLEILQTDGTPVGSIMSTGFLAGSAPPGAPPGLLFNMPVTGGTGAFTGTSGVLTSAPFTLRVASMQEDPANRRSNGGGKGHFMVYLIPLLKPEIVITRNGPAIVHASDSSLVTASKPAKGGEVLTLYATGLGPTRPALEPGKVFTADPLQLTNSSIEVSVGGQLAEVLYAGGYPGSSDAFQVNFRIPNGVAPGTPSLQLTAAFIPGGTVGIPVQ